MILFAYFQLLFHILKLQLDAGLHHKHKWKFTLLGLFTGKDPVTMRKNYMYLGCINQLQIHCISKTTFNSLASLQHRTTLRWNAYLGVTSNIGWKMVRFYAAFNFQVNNYSVHILFREVQNMYSLEHCTLKSKDVFPAQNFHGNHHFLSKKLHQRFQQLLIYS